jgi:hypothetical protein
MTQRPSVLFCDLTTCYSTESAWFHRLKLKCDEPLSDFAVKFNLRRYKNAANAEEARKLGFLVIDVKTAEVWRCRLTLSNSR